MAKNKKRKKPKSSPPPVAAKKEGPWYMNIDVMLTEVASVMRASAKFGYSALILGSLVVLLYIGYNAGWHYWDTTPGWVKWILKVLGK